MFRRDFINRLTAVGAMGAAAVASAGAEEASSVSFRVKGFTCITCAVGLEVVLAKQRGVLQAKASYEEKKVDIRFDEKQTSPEALREFINRTTGFTVEEIKA